MAYEVVVIGTSLGGLRALEIVLSGLGKEFPLPVTVVQHREKDSSERLCELLQSHCALRVGQAEDKEEITPGRVYLAPPDYHLLVEEGRLALSTEAPVHYARPSVDVLFESAADAYGERVVGVILTGSGKDGAQGSARIRERGGFVVVQDPETAESRAMPEAAMAACEVDLILPLSEIGPLLSTELRSVKGKTVGA